MNNSNEIVVFICVILILISLVIGIIYAYKTYICRQKKCTNTSCPTTSCPVCPDTSKWLYYRILSNGTEKIIGLGSITGSFVLAIDGTKMFADSIGMESKQLFTIDLKKPIKHMKNLFGQLIVYGENDEELFVFPKQSINRNGNVIYITPNGKLTCIDIYTNEIIWEKELENIIF